MHPARVDADAIIREVPSTGFLRMRFLGSICALATPFDDAGAPDFEAWKRLLDLHLAAGSDGVVVGGSTGESGALEEHELVALLEMAAERLRGRSSVIAGCGASSTARAARLMGVSAQAGADAALVVTPPYVRPTQEGLLAHYRALADAGDIPVILYNVPGRTGCDLLPATVANLAAHPRIVGIKEARSEPERMQALLELRAKEFVVLSGDDPTAMRALCAGADGVVSVAANVCPRAFSALCKAAANGDAQRAQEIDRDLADINAFLGCEPNPIPVKWLLHRMGLIGSALRLPLLPLSSQWHDTASAVVELVARLESR